MNNSFYSVIYGPPRNHQSYYELGFKNTIQEQTYKKHIINYHNM